MKSLTYCALEMLDVWLVENDRVGMEPHVRMAAVASALQAAAQIIAHQHTVHGTIQ